jgi:hypothetical protein
MDWYYSARALGRLMEAMGISTPGKLRKAILNLQHQTEIEKYVALAHSLSPDSVHKTNFRNTDTRDIQLFDLLFVFLLANPVVYADWGESSIGLGLDLLRTLEYQLFAQFFLDDDDYRAYEDLDEKEVEVEGNEMRCLPKEAVPIRTTRRQIEAFSTVWHLRACFEPGDPEYNCPLYPKMVMPLLGNLSICSLLDTTTTTNLTGFLRWHKDWPQFDPLRCVMKLWQSELESVPYILYEVSHGLENLVPENKYDLLCGTKIVEDLWKHANWATGRDNACRLLESNLRLVDTAAAWRVLNSPRSTPDVLSICLLWPEVDLYLGFTAWDTAFKKQSIPAIAEAFRRAPIKAVSHALKTLVPSKISVQLDQGPSLLHYAALFGCTEIVEC